MTLIYIFTHPWHSSVEYTIFFDANKSQHEQWTREWTEIKGMRTDIKPICEVLQLTVKQYNQDSIAVSFVTTTEAISSPNLSIATLFYVHLNSQRNSS
jgi:hypothetical protein